jgi:polysaccharide biosynthesis/export protein
MFIGRIPAHVRVAGICLLATIFAGCGSLRGRHEQDRIPEIGTIDPRQPKELEMASLPPYVVEPPDEIEINIRPSVLDLPTTQSLIVQPDGTIDLGFAGDVYISNLTLDQIELKIAQHLEKQSAAEGKPLRARPRVSIRLVNGSQSKTYFVLGTVTTQGKFPCTGNETVLEAILGAGLRTNSLPEKAYLVRPHPIGAEQTILRIDWEGITKRGETLTNYQVLPGDRIIVPGTKSPGLLSSLVGG